MKASSRPLSMCLFFLSILLLISCYPITESESSNTNNSGSGTGTGVDKPPKYDDVVDHDVATFAPPADSEVSGNIYEVGPGRQYTDLTSIPWTNLSAGDLVKIHYRAEPYRSIIALNVSGTETDPIRIYGIPDAAGNLPVISGENATEGPTIQGFFDQWTEGLGVIVIYGGWDNKPANIEIANLKVIRAHPDYSYIDDEGIVKQYGRGAAGFWLLADNVSIKGCVVMENGNGIFTQANANVENRVSRKLLVERSKIYSNGVAGSDRQHNMYIQSAGAIIQFNYIGTLAQGADGSAYKDRCSGTVIRYNYIESGARTLDLVEPDGCYSILSKEPDFDAAYIYGNIILNDENCRNGGAVNVIHYGGDQGNPAQCREGTLYFYNNTVYIKANRSNKWRLNLFDITIGTAGVQMYNNIIMKEGDTYFHLLRDGGNIHFNNSNWITTGYLNVSDQAPNPGRVTAFAGAIITGTDAGFTAIGAGDFTLAADSPCQNRAVSLPAYVYPVNHQYDSITMGKKRTQVKHLGAIE